MKRRFLAVVLISVVLLSACSASKENSDENNISKLKEVDSFEIQFLTAQQLSSEDREVLQLNFTVKNKSVDTRMFDSLAFVAVNKEGDKLEISPNENFGSDLEPGETKEGSIYYYLGGSAPIIVTYDDLDNDETETWEIKEIEK